MFSYVMRRLMFGALTVVGVSIVVFVLMRILPGDPLVAIFGPEGYTKLTDQERAHYMAELGLGDPLFVQYLAWLGDIARGDLGHSFFRSESVAEMILRRGPLTAQIAFLSVVLSWLVGIPIAILSALRPNTLADHVARLMSILFLAVPGFWLGMLIVLTLFVRVRLPGAADGRLDLHRSVDHPADDHRARHRAWPGPGRLYRAHGPLQPARSGARGLCAHGTGQGPQQPPGDCLPRLAQCAVAGHHPVGSSAWLRARRIDPGGTGVRHARVRLCHVHGGERA